MGPLIAALAVLLVVGGLGLGAAEILRAPAAPAAGDLPRLGLDLAAPVLGQGLPLAAMAGVAALLGRWREEGDWLGVRAAGWGGRALLPGLALVALAVGAATWGVTHHLEPAARADLRALLREGLRPAPGRLIALGGAAVTVDAASDGGAEGIRFAWVRGGWAGEGDGEGTAEQRPTIGVGGAASGSLGPDGLSLVDGVVHLQGARVAFETAQVPASIAAPPRARIELVERSDERLAALIARMEANQKDASYEAAVLAKRSAWPVAAGLLVLLAAPWSLSGRRGRLVAAVFGYWAMVRGMDHLASAVGGAVSAWTPPAALAAVTIWTWARWRDR